MNSSQSMHIVAQIAGAEAHACANKHLEPEHLFLVLTKLEDLGQAIPASAMFSELRRDAKWLSDRFHEARLDPTAVRRRLRKLMHISTEHQGQFTGHRSDRCREIFGSAEELAVETGEREIGVHQFLVTLIVESSPRLQEAVRSVGSSWSALRRAVGLNVTKEDTVSVTASRAKREEIPPQVPHAGGRRRSKKPQPASLVEKVGRDLTALARAGKMAPCVGRRDEMRLVAQILRRQSKNNPVLVGDPGVGKTCIVEGLAQRVVHEKAPEAIRNWRIIEISMSSLLAGSMFRGQFEERLQRLIQEASNDPNLIVFIDELHTMVGAGGSSGQGMDAAQILKPALARGDMKVIGATTITEYRQYIESDAALERRFQMIWVDEPTREEAIEILMGLQPGLEKHHGLPIAEETITKAVEFSMRFMTEHRLPDKAIDLIDQACAGQMLATLSPASTDSDVPPEPLTPDHLASVVAARCRIPVGMLTTDERVRLREMEASLRQRVMGQDEAIHEVSAAVRSARVGLKDASRPSGVFLFLGPTGVGKTETAKALAEFLFGAEDALIRFDMSEYKEKHEVAKLIGAPPGYIGHDQEGQLISKVRTKPYSVILFDEVEKAHPEVFDLLLQVFDEGRLTDAKGRRASFRESVIVMTSNLGCRVVDPAGGGRTVFGFHPRRDESDNEKGRESTDAARAEHIQAIADDVRRFFRPEFLNRIQAQIVFQPLTRDVLHSILGKLVAALNRRLEEKRVTIRLTAEAKDRLVDDGFDGVFGARALERVFDKQISERLAAELLEERINEGHEVTVGVGDAGFEFRAQLLRRASDPKKSHAQEELGSC